VLEQQAGEAFGPLHAERLAGIALLLVTALLVLAGAWLAARSLSRPISRVIAASRRVAEGDLTAHDADLGEPGPGESGDLVRSIREMTARLRTLIGHVQESIVMLLSTATEIAATSRQQERTVHEYGDSINQVAAAVNQITATSQELSRTMNEVNGLASTAGTKVKDGQDLLGGLLGTMHQLAESTATISSRLTVISERANNINLVVTTITKVADQTNLLSINAAIEAEKAGEFGRGFSVVAREIRRLADQTAAATLDIERIVKEMQHSVATGVMEMDKYHVQVRQGVQDAGVIGDRLGQIISAVERLTPRFDQVAEGMSAQSQGAQQIREAMGQLAEGAGQTIQSLREFNKATDQLRDAVTNLKDDVARFQT
jgi:methyl-accepting chemotaxis protein WspA